MGGLVNDFYPTPRGFFRGVWRWSLVGLFGLALLAGLIFGGWKAGWWFAGQDANNQARVIQEGYSNQTTLRAQITEQIANTYSLSSQIAAGGSGVQALKDQRAAIVGIACSDAAQISGVPLPAQQGQWVSVNCLDGTVRPGSPYYQSGE